MQIKVMRLMSDEWVISEVIGALDTATEVHLKNPCVMMGDEKGIGMVPLSPFSDDKAVVISLAHVLFVSEPKADLRNAYAAQFGGVVVPTPGLDLG